MTQNSMNCFHATVVTSKLEIKKYLICAQLQYFSRQRPRHFERVDWKCILWQQWSNSSELESHVDRVVLIFELLFCIDILCLANIYKK